MEELLCVNCGAPFELSTAADGAVKCKFCGSVFTLPKPEQTPED